MFGWSPSYGVKLVDVSMPTAESVETKHSAMRVECLAWSINLLM